MKQFGSAKQSEKKSQNDESGRFKKLQESAEV